MARRAIVAVVSCAVSLLGGSGPAAAELGGGPGVGAKFGNVFVGIEAVEQVQRFDVDTRDLRVELRRADAKVTTGLADWLDVYLRAGAAQLLHDYRNNEYVQQYLGQVSKGYDGGPRLGLGGGGRLWWRGHAGARVAGFLQADAYYVRSEGTIQAARDTSRVVRRDRKLDWADVGAAVGLARQGSAAAVHFGVGISEAWWRIRDTDQVQHAGFGWRVGYPTRSTWEVHEPVFVFAGVELLLPHEFRISTQGAVRTAESFAIGVAVCQGLERQE